MLDTSPSQRNNASCSAWVPNTDFGQKVRNRRVHHVLAHSSRIILSERVPAPSHYLTGVRASNRGATRQNCHRLEEL